jgi:hypothetical protein
MENCTDCCMNGKEIWVRERVTAIIGRESDEAVTRQAVFVERGKVVVFLDIVAIRGSLCISLLAMER